jgi:Polyketide cyclase / dehydrase and lipid transport
MRWPSGMEPGRALVHAHNEIVTTASPEYVWDWLCRASAWPQWYRNCAWLNFPNGDGPDLKQNTQFVWKTFGATVRSTVVVFDPMREIGWDAYAIGLRAFHGWLIEPLDQGGCRIVTEETQNGPLVWIGRSYLRRALLREHQNWLESLSNVAAKGPPD